MALALRGQELTQLPEEHQLAQALLPSPRQRILVDRLTLCICRAQARFGSCSQYLEAGNCKGALQKQLCSLLQCPLMVEGSEGLTLGVFVLFCSQVLLALESILPSSRRSGLTSNVHVCQEISAERSTAAIAKVNFPSAALQS